MKLNFLLLAFLMTTLTYSQTEISTRLTDIAIAPQADHIKADITTLVGFGTRHTLSDTISKTRGIGAARRWVKSAYDRISKDCNGCLEVSYQKALVDRKSVV